MTTALILNLILGVATVVVTNWTTNQQIGILNWIVIPLWLQVLVTLLVMDLFAQYIPHYLMHKVKFLWRFNVVQHSDTHVDVSTGTRHHPGEWLLRESFTIVGIIIMGVPVGLYFIHRSFQALFTYFNHANISLPKWLDRIISLIFCIP